MVITEHGSKTISGGPMFSDGYMASLNARRSRLQGRRANLRNFHVRGGRLYTRARLHVRKRFLHGKKKLAQI